MALRLPGVCVLYIIRHGETPLADYRPSALWSSWVKYWVPSLEIVSLLFLCCKKSSYPGEVLRFVDEVLPEPVSQRNSDSVQAITHHLIQIVLVNVSFPMSPKVIICNLLTLTHDALKLGLFSFTFLTGPFFPVDLRLVDEERAKIYTSDLVACWKQSLAGTSLKEIGKEFEITLGEGVGRGVAGKLGTSR